MAFTSALASRVPLVIILGATGTGKTKLGIELAQKYQTEIISADSMQGTKQALQSIALDKEEYRTDACRSSAVLPFSSMIESSPKILALEQAVCTQRFYVSPILDRFNKQIRDELNYFYSEIYKGLDIVTAKASEQERAAAKHHLIDMLEPHQTFTVVDFRNRALNIIDCLLKENKIPLVVGGTNYYIESVLWDILIENIEDSGTFLISDRNESARKRLKIEEEQSAAESELRKHPEIPTSDTSKKEDRYDILKKFVQEEHNHSSEELHAKLQEIDPVMAERLHPNNRRKILRSLLVWTQTGRLCSEILSGQKEEERKLRMPNNTLVFWLKCEQEIHDQMLNKRVDAMLEAGLIKELTDFHVQYNKRRMTEGQLPDYTTGVFQTLGFKEFHEYLMLDDEGKQSDIGKKMFDIGLETMKMATRRYARLQNKMVRNRFLDHPTRDIPPIYELDMTDLSKWDLNVKGKAIEVIDSFIKNETCHHKPLEPTSAAAAKKEINRHASFQCDTCHRIFVGDDQYKIHLKSNRHKRVLKKRNKERASEIALRKFIVDDTKLGTSNKD